MARAGRPLAWVAAISLFVAAVWYGLISEHVTVDERPEPTTVEAYYDWYATTVTQERIDGAIAVLGVASLIVVAWALRARLAPEGAGAAVGALAVTIGSLLWIVGNILDLGGAKAVKELSRADGAIEPVNAINYTIDTIDDAFETFGFAFLGIGVLALAWEALRATQRRAWVGSTVVTGLVFLALSVAYAAESWDVVDLLLVLGGAIVLPGWLIWSAETVLRPQVEPDVPDGGNPPARRRAKDQDERPRA